MPGIDVIKWLVIGVSLLLAWILAKLGEGNR